MIYEPFSIVVVPFPFTGLEYTKKRPAIVLSSSEHQLKNLHVTLIMLTTAKKSSWDNDYALSSLTGTGLTTQSIVRQKIFTIDSRLIIKAIGKLTLQDKDAVIKQLKTHFCIN